MAIDLMCVAVVLCMFPLCGIPFVCDCVVLLCVVVVCKYSGVELHVVR